MDKEHELVLAELIIKVAALEKLLITKGITSSEEYTKIMKNMSEEVIKYVSNKTGN
jgi:hypothetical protein